MYTPSLTGWMNRTTLQCQSFIKVAFRGKIKKSEQTKLEGKYGGGLLIDGKVIHKESL